ncbi:MAG: DUF3127 domain-containing protein [Saprospiraceae bacterium]|nr:DUF3127 domain-containing protein [Saprospiraceae bacterium]
MSFNVSGKLHKVFPAETKTATFQTREFVIVTEEQYPQYIKFQLVQDRCGVIDQFTPGQVINVFFDLRGREWQEKYFTNLQAWKVEAGAGAEAGNTPGNANQAAGGSLVGETKADDPFGGPAAENFDDLPF